MVYNDFVPMLQQLPRADAIRVIQLIADDLAREHGVMPFHGGAAYPV